MLAFGLALNLAQAAHLPEPATADDFHPTDPKKVALGKLLSFDKVLSGNLNISCLTCHHPMAGTGDGLALPVGEGGEGLGVTRNTGTDLGAIHERVPRNAPHLFALGAKEFNFLFHDGRVSVDPTQPSGFQSPAGDHLPLGLDNVVAVQAMFPVTSAAEMAGQEGENDQADAAASAQGGDFSGVWNHIAEKIQAIPEYVDLFVDTYPDVDQASDITYVHAANAIAAFEINAWSCSDSPFDAYLRGDRNALTRHQIKGMRLFYGKAGCSTCHSGTFLTDNDFHAIAMPQIGPGKGDGPDGRDDFGRGRETGEAEDMYRFRTPTLRMVAMTAPYGHAGAYDTLEAVVRHHLDPVNSLVNYDPTQARLPSRPDLDALDFVVMSDPNRVAAIAAANELEPVALREREIFFLMAFLRSLTDPRCLDLRRDVPTSLPSGLPLFD
jgi:cytochrome c peroxidase